MYDYSDSDDEESFTIDLGSGALESACPTPRSPPLRLTSETYRPPRRTAMAKALKDREGEKDCGICFEPAAIPVRTVCCSRVFCTEHIAHWLHGPQSDGLCPTCRAPSPATGLTSDLLSIGQLLVPCTPPVSRAPSPLPYAASKISPAPYASYPSHPESDSLSSSSWSSSEDEDEDATDFSLPALIRARKLQTRRHTSHSFTTVLGVWGGLASVARVAGWVLVVAALAGGGRWTSAGMADS